LGDNPRADIRKYQYRCVADIKKALALNDTLLDSCNGVQYDSTTREENNTGNATLPSTIVTECTVYYTQDRRYPHLIAN
jgi:hypothetical protein